VRWHTVGRRWRRRSWRCHLLLLLLLHACARGSQRPVRRGDRRRVEEWWCSNFCNRCNFCPGSWVPTQARGSAGRERRECRHIRWWGSNEVWCNGKAARTFTSDGCLHHFSTHAKQELLRVTAADFEMIRRASSGSRSEISLSFAITSYFSLVQSLERIATAWSPAAGTTSWCA
jgi:hypothetical protein